MAALTADRNTPMKDGNLIPFKMAAGKKAYAGGIACVNLAGFAVPGSEDPKLVYLGRFEETVDNTAGGDGAVFVLVRRGMVFLFENLSADPVTQSLVGRDCYIADDQTVAATNGPTNARPPCGIVLAVDAGGVWVGREMHELRVATASLDFSAIPAAASADLNISYAGAIPGDIVVLGLPAAPAAGLVFGAFVSTANVITVRATNITAAPVDAAPAVFTVAVGN